jgi:hypothetical protein
MNKRHLILTLSSVLASLKVFSQTPSHFPHPKPTPVDFFENTASVIFYIVIPAVVAVLYVVWKRSLSRQQKEQ